MAFHGPPVHRYEKDQRCVDMSNGNVTGAPTIKSRSHTVSKYGIQHLYWTMDFTYQWISVFGRVKRGVKRKSYKLHCTEGRRHLKYH